MQVLHVIKATGLAGAENHLMTLLPGLREQGIDARLWLWVPPHTSADEIIEAANARNIPIERWIMPGMIAPGFFARVVKYLRQQRPDIVHTHLVHAETYAIPAARLAGVPFVVNSCHNDDPFRFLIPFRVQSWLRWRMTHRGIAISQAIKDFLIKTEFARDQQIAAIPYGLQAPPRVAPERTLHQELGLPPSARIVGSMCRLIEQKGLTYALDAMALLMPRYPDLHYVIAGTGTLQEDLKAQAAASGIAERVHFIGWRTDVQALMAQFEIFLAPSLWEGFGLVFLEAMGQARPVISTRVSSIPEVVDDGVTGLLVPPRDGQAIAGALERLLNDPACGQRMGEAGRTRLAQVFTPERMIAQTIDVYHSL